MGLRFPQQVAGEGAQRGGGVPQRLAELRAAARGAWIGPGLKQCRGRGRAHLLDVGRREVGAYRGPHRRVQPDGANRVARVHAEQAELLQGGVGGPHKVAVGVRLAVARASGEACACGVTRALGDASAAGDEGARGGGGEDGGRDPAGVEGGGEYQGRPGKARGRQLVGVLDGERPGGEQRLRATFDQRLRGGPQAHRVLGAVVPAGALGHGDHGGGLCERERLPAEVLGQVKRLDPLVGEGGEPGIEVGERLAPAEPGDGVGGHVGARPGKLGLTQLAGHDHLPRRAARPQPVDVDGGGHAVEYHRPAALGRAQPAEETLGGAFCRAGGRPVVDQQVQVRRRPRVARDDRAPVSGGNPGQHVDRPRRPHRVRESDRELCLARPARPEQRRHEEDRLTGPQRVGQAEAGFLTRVVEGGKRRDRSGEDRCPSTLSTHVRCPPTCDAV